MTVLTWRPHTRARLLREMNESIVVGVTVRVLGECLDVGERTAAQLLEDLRLGIPFDEAPELDVIHPHRRRPWSTVYHTHEACSAWPGGEYVEHLGEPPLGMACRECGRLWG